MFEFFSKSILEIWFYYYDFNIRIDLVFDNIKKSFTFFD